MARNRRGLGDRGSYFRDGSTFVKQYSSDVEVEYEKGIKLHEIALETNLFIAAKPCDLDSEHSRISYEFIDQSHCSLRELYIHAISGKADLERAAMVFSRIGEVLAAIHRDAALSVTSDWFRSISNALGPKHASLARMRPFQSPNVLLHGDFGFSNLFLLDDATSNAVDSAIWLVDPSPNFFMTFRADAVGPAEVDLANLAACMHGLFPVSRQLSCQWRHGDFLYEQVLAGYSALSGYSPNRELLQQLVRLTLSQYLRQRASNRIMRKMILRMLDHRVSQSNIYEVKI